MSDPHHRHALTAYCAISAPLTYEAATVMAAYAATDRRLAALASSFSAFKVCGEPHSYLVLCLLPFRFFPFFLPLFPPTLFFL